MYSSNNDWSFIIVLVVFALNVDSTGISVIVSKYFPPNHIMGGMWLSQQQQTLGDRSF